MAFDNLGDQQWEAARLAVREVFFGRTTPVWELEGILKFLDYHVGLQGAGEDYGSHIIGASWVIIKWEDMEEIHPLTIKCVRDFNWTSPSFVRGLLSMMNPSNLTDLRAFAVGLIAVVSDRWFGCPGPVMEQEEMFEFCGHVATFMNRRVLLPHAKKWSVTILFGMLRSSEWRKCIDTRFWSVLVHCPLVEELESVRWCLQNATILLDFAKGLPDQGEGLKWWCWTLWFHYEKIDVTARVEVEKIAEEMVRNDRRSDLSLYLNLIQEEISKIQQELSEEPKEFTLPKGVRSMRARLVDLEGNYDRLARIRNRSR